MRVQLGYSEGTVGYSEDTVRVHWGTVRVQLGYSEIRREEERVRRRREGGYIEGTGRIQWGYSESTTGPRSAVGNVSGYRCVSDCNSRGREFDPGPVSYFCGD